MADQQKLDRGLGFLCCSTPGHERHTGVFGCRNGCLACELEVAKRRVKELEAALAPFAEQASILDSLENETHDGEALYDVYHFTLKGSYSAITVGDCRQALRALMGGANGP